MTDFETSTIINRVLNLYPSHAKKLNQADRRAMVKTWADTFANYSYEEMDKAVKLYLRHGKPYLPDPADIISELNYMSEYEDSKLFMELEKAADMAANPTEHVVIDDLGGIEKDPSSPTGFRFVTAEAHISCKYDQSDFRLLPEIIQRYAEDVKGLQALDREIKSNRHFTRRRFMDRVQGMRRQIKLENAK